MKKWMKKAVATILLTTIAISIGAPAFAAVNETNTTENNQCNIISKEELSTVELAQIATFEEKGINVFMTKDGQIKLTDTSTNNIQKANQILASARAAYPTEWVSMPQYSVYTSKHFKAATATALSTLLTAWLGTTTSIARLIAIFVTGYGTTCFILSDEDDIYYSKTYSYREVGPGKFDSAGTFIGDYQIARVDRTTTNSNYTGGEFVEDIGSIPKIV